MLVLASPVIVMEKIKTPAFLRLECTFNSPSFLPVVLLSSHYLSGYNILLVSHYVPKLKRNVSSSGKRECHTLFFCNLFQKIETSKFFCNQESVIQVLVADK